MGELVISVAHVETPDGVKDYVVCLPRETAFEKGLVAEAIMGTLLRPLEISEGITPQNFARNPVFVDFMHSVIARHAPESPGFIAEARRMGDGLVCIVDQRTRTPEGPVPSQDIVGIFRVESGQAVPDSYRPNPNHLILSADGFVRLPADLQERLLEELAIRS